jgi:hypothetical protein
LHPVSCHVNTIIPNISKHIWKGTLMKISTWAHVIIVINAILYFPLSFSAHLTAPLVRQFNNKVQVNFIGHQHIHQNPQQILFSLKKNIEKSKKIKSDTLHSIAATIGNKSKFKPFLTEQKVIEQSIEQFNKTPGYLRVFLRVIEGTVNKNAAQFNGAMAEIQLALCKLYENNKILEFNRVITDINGKRLTEIDLETEDKDGKKVWCEVKVRKQQPFKAFSSIKKQVYIQKKLAQEYKIDKHELFIVADPKELILTIPKYNSHINDEKPSPLNASDTIDEIDSEDNVK